MTLDEDEEELEQVVSAETQEWDGLEAAEAEADEQTLRRRPGTGSSRPVPQSPRASRRSVRGRKITTGFKAVRRHVRLPALAALPDRLLRDHRLDRGRHLGEPDPLPLGHRQRAQEPQRDPGRGSVPDPTPGSGPQTILILGSDKRNQQISGKYGPLRHDDAAPTRSGPGRDRPALPAARSEGGHPGRRDRQAQRRVLARRPEADAADGQAAHRASQINHLVNVDFTGFARAVNAIGCVYVDVDHRYYHRTPRHSAPTTTRRSTSNPATRRSAALTPSPSRATATPTTTSSAPPASRRSCARPGPRCRPRG